MDNKSLPSQSWPSRRHPFQPSHRDNNDARSVDARHEKKITNEMNEIETDENENEN